MELLNMRKQNSLASLWRQSDGFAAAVYGENGLWKRWILSTV